MYGAGMSYNPWLTLVCLAVIVVVVLAIVAATRRKK
jgi:hypothetical protein